MNTVFTVSQLNKQVKLCLEQEIGEVVVNGELSNLSRPKSGHLYFSLKDEYAQLRCVYFRNYHNTFCATLSNGDQVTVKGSLSLYEARGDCQLIAQDVSPMGQGALLLQFQLLKDKLHEEGLFNAALKRRIPLYPTIIGVITSPSSAAFQDIVITIQKRFPLSKIYLYPSEVQGKDAIHTLVKSLMLASKEPQIDVLIIARGGGSIEDLQAFNDERFARLIREAPFPIITGIGHETDFTIADYVSDHRAATPTAAAMSATPNACDILQLIEYHKRCLFNAMTRALHESFRMLERCHQKLKGPELYLQQLWQRLDNAACQLTQKQLSRIERAQYKLSLLEGTLQKLNPKNQLICAKTALSHITDELLYVMQNTINSYTHRLNICSATLHAVSPLATLSRGYAIARLQNTIIDNSASVNLHDQIEIKLSKGALQCEVIGKS